MKRSVTTGSTQLSPAAATSTWHSLPVKFGRGREEKERVLDEAYDEYCKLRDAGEVVCPSQFCERYPTYRKSLRKLLDVHEVLDESDWETTAWPQCDSVFLGFVIHRELGVGAIARVYLASEVALGRRLVALKVAPHGGQEAETLGKLTHPNVVPVHSAPHDSETGLTAVCMPYLGSSTLADVLELVFGGDRPPRRANQILEAARQRELLPEFWEAQRTEVPDRILLRGDYVDGVIHQARQLAEALEYMHGHGVLHRDLKPSNVLVTPSGRPMLLDFNLSCDEELHINRMGGTLPYMAPEQIRQVFAAAGGSDEPADPRSDVFALGVILYEMLTGRLPFGDPPVTGSPRKDAEAYSQAQREEWTPVDELNPRAGRWVAQTIERCLDPDPQRRPQTAAALAKDLQQHFAIRQRLGRSIYRHRRGAIAAAALMLLAAAGIAWHLATRPAYDMRQYLQGTHEFRNTRYEAAVQQFDQAVAANPDSVLAHFGLGVARLRLAEMSESIQLFASAARSLEKAAPVLDEAIAYEGLAYAWYKSKEPRKAAFHYQMAIDRAPRKVALYLHRAFCLIQSTSGNPEAVLNEAIQLDDTLRDAFYLRLVRVRIAERYGSADARGHSLRELALEDLDTALSIGPPEVFVLAFRCCQYAEAARDRPELHSRLVESVRQAVEGGCPRSALEGNVYLRDHLDEGWFVELLAACDPAAQPASPHEFVRPPDPQAIDAILSRP